MKTHNIIIFIIGLSTYIKEIIFTKEFIKMI